MPQGMKRNLAILGLTFLLIGLSLPQVYYSTPVTPNVYVIAYGWGSPSSPVNAHAGYTDFPFYVEASQVDATIIGMSISVPSGSPFTVVGETSTGVTSTANGESLAIFYLTVSNTTSPGYYPVRVTVTYAVNIAAYTCVEGKTFTLQVPVYGVNFPTPVGVQWGVSTVQQAFVGEGLVPLTIQVANPSDHVEDNVVINVSLPKGVYSQGGQRYALFTASSIPAQGIQEVTQLVNVSQLSSPGNYTLNYTVSFMNYLGYHYYATNFNITSGNANVTFGSKVPLEISIYPKSPLQVYATQGRGTPSSVVSVILRLNSSVNYFVDSIVTQSSLSLAFTNFTPSSGYGQSTYNFTFDVSPTTAPGVYPINFQVSYQELGQTFQASVTTYIYVNYFNVSPTLSDPTWGSPQDQLIPTPGMTGVPLSFILANPFPYPISGVNVSLKLPSGISSPYTNFLVPSIQSFGSYQVSFNLNLASNLTPGYVTIPYTVSFSSYYGTSVYHSKVAIYVYPSEEISLQYGNTTIYQGSQQSFPLVLINQGSTPVSSVSVRLTGQGISLVGMSNQTVNYLAAGENVTLLYQLYAPQGLGVGTYPLSLIVSYNYQGVTKTLEYTIPFNVIPSQQLVSVSVLPSVVYYGVPNNITVRVLDTAEVPLYNVQLRLFSQPSLYSISQNSVDLGTLYPGRAENIGLVMLPTVTSTSSLPLGLTVEYLLPGGSSQEEGYNFSLISTGLVKLVLQQPSALVSNGTVTVNGILNNFGTASANFVTVYVNGSPTYIGSVPPNSPTPFSYTFTPSQGGVQHVNIVVSYEDSLYQPHNITYQLAYTLTQTNLNQTHFLHHSRQNVLPILIYIVVVLVITSAIIYVLRRGKK
jgi:hypothetical protein